MAKDSAVRIEIGRSFHQLGTVQVRSVRVIWYLFGMAPQDVVHLQNASFWRAHKFELASLGILVQCQLWSCRQTSAPWIWCERLLVASVPDEERGNVSFFRLIKDHSGCCILDQLQRLDSTCGKTRQESITIVQSGENKSLDKELCSLLWQEGLIFLMLYKAKSAGPGRCSNMVCEA